MTWARLLEGAPTRADILVTVFRYLWPGSRGDWRAVLNGSVGADADDQDYVPAPGPRAEADVSNAEVLAELRRVREELAALRKGMEKPK